MEIETNDNPQTNQTKKNRVFIAKLWINTITKEGENKGKKFMSGNIDNKFKKITIGVNDQINIWPNKKRPNVRDADFRVSLLTDQKVPENVNGPTKEDKEVQPSEIDAIMA
jgi:uncharacterized protein (DUF736 family)